MTDLIEEYAKKMAKQAAEEATKEAAKEKHERNVEVALSLLADGMNVEFAAKHSKLTLEEVRALAEKRSA